MLKYIEYWVWLTTLPYIGNITRNKLLQKFCDPCVVYKLSKYDLLECDFLNCIQVNSIMCNKSLNMAYDIINSCNKNNISIMTIYDKIYLKKAMVNNVNPILLYYKGKVKNIEKSVGIVGARRCTQDDKFFTEKITKKYIDNNYVVVSGMAKGVDSYATTTCINNNKYSIVVFGNGIDICYPKEHKIIVDKIVDNGLIISEYPPGTKPTRYNFPSRNRIISAWSDKLIVIAPGKNSGSLITAKYSINLNREVKIYGKC